VFVILSTGQLSFLSLKELRSSDPDLFGCASVTVCGW